MPNKRKPLNLKKYKYATEYLQDVDKEKKGIPTRGRMPKLERSLVTKKVDQLLIVCQVVK